MNSLEQRIQALEIRIAHQDQTIADLNEVITAQWKKLDMMDRNLRRMGEELDAMESNEAPPVQKPPHY